MVKLSYQRYFNCANVRHWTAFFSRWEVVCSDADAFDFHVWQESASNDFCNIDCSAYAFSACFHAYLFCSAVKESYAGKHVVHDWLRSDKHCVVFWHSTLLSLVSFLVWL